MKTKRYSLISCRLRPLVLAVACALAGSAFAQNLPSGFNNVTGVNTPTITGNTMTVTQTTQRGIAEWQSFSIGRGYGVKFNQPNSSSVLLNRVVGNDPSTIAGNISANGHIYLINPNGVLFSRGSSVNAGGLIASTLNVSNSDFLTGGKLKFARPDGNDAAVINEGSITVAPGGTIGLMAARVTNTGTLSAPGGTVGLVSARAVNVDFDGDGLTTFTIPSDSLASAAWVENSGQVDADGGRIALLAASTVREQVVKQSGTLRARSLSNRGGEIVLGGDTASGNEVLVSGELDVSGNAAGVAGGSVSIDASTVMVEGARIDASGVGRGGNIAVRAQGAAGNGVVSVDANSRLHADAVSGSGNGGHIDLLADARLSAHGTLTARAGATGGDGGFIETSAAAVNLGDIRVDASAPAGNAGLWLIDPVNFQIVPSSWGPCVGSCVYDSAINSALNAGNNVTITTVPVGVDPGDVGNIRIEPGVVIRKTTGATAVTLMLNAHNDILGSHAYSVIESTAGALNVEFRAGRHLSYSGSIITNGGYVEMHGNGGGGLAGVLLYGATINTRGGYVTLRGIGSGNSSPGVWMRNSRINAGAGDVSITGISLADPSGQSDYGISLWNSHIVTTSGGIRLLGGSGGNWWGGVWLGDTGGGSTITSTSGRIDVTGSASASGAPNAFGILIDGNSRISSSDDVILRASNNGASDALRIDGQVSAGNVLNLRPGEVNAGGDPADRPDVPIVFSLTGDGGQDLGHGFSISTSELAHMRASTIVVGSNTHTGSITVNGSITASSRLTLQNGSGGIRLNGSVRAPVLGLVSAGNITQSSGSITASDLLVRSSGGNVDLKGSNNVKRLSGEAPGGRFDFINSSALAIVPADRGVRGYNATDDIPMTITTASLDANRVFVRTLSGDLTLAMPIISTSTELVAGWRFQNPGSGSITGGPWRVWAGYWIGETRGGMNGDDIFNCVYGACEVGAGNYFIYGPPYSLFFELPEEVRMSKQISLEWLSEEDASGRPEGAGELDGIQGSEQGRGLALICLDTIMSGSVSDAGPGSDVLDREWSRVHAKPRTSGCLGVDGRKGCAGF